MRFMGVLYVCKLVARIAMFALVRAHKPDHQFGGILYVTFVIVFAVLYFSWRKHYLFVACAFGALLSVLFAYQMLRAGFIVQNQFWTTIAFVGAPIVLCVSGGMFVWYPLKLIKRVT